MTRQSKNSLARGETVAPSAPTANSMKNYTEQDLAERFTELFPGTFAEDVLGDPVDKKQARILGAAVSRRLVMELSVRVFGGGFSPRLAAMIDRAVLTHQRVVGNLGERVVTLPDNLVAAFLKEMKEDPDKPREAVELIDAMPGLAEPQKALGPGGKS